MLLIREDRPELQRLKYLWRTVILQVILDMECKKQRSEYRQLRQDAFLWCSKDKKNFRLVCSYSGMCESIVRKKLIELADRLGLK